MNMLESHPAAREAIKKEARSSRQRLAVVQGTGE